jgi:hypothetical protein
MTDDMVNLRTLLENSAPPPGRRAGCVERCSYQCGPHERDPDLTCPLEFQPAEPASQRFAVKEDRIRPDWAHMQPGTDSRLCAP